MAVKTDDGSVNTFDFKSIEEFLAQAYALEIEVAERYEEMADAMEVHNNPEVAGLFRELAEQSQKHGAEMKERSRNKALPRIAPWNFKWGDGDGPETPSMDKIHYLMTPYHALDMARQAETQARDFYAGVAGNAASKEIADLAAEFVTEEAEHVAVLESWITKYPKPSEDWDFDPDPPGNSE